MKTAIFYSTKYGSVEKCIEILKKEISGEIEIINLKKRKSYPKIDGYDRVIVAGSVYAGRIQKEVKEFCLKNSNELECKNSSYFICASNIEKSKEQLALSFPENLLKKAVAVDCFGGKLILKKLNFFERFLVKRVAKIREDFCNINEEKIAQFARTVESAK
jgi:menaquinone-dependent protoporphyrinogen oxidase